MNKTAQEIIDWCRVEPGRKVKLKDFDPSWAGNPAIPKKDRRKLAEDLLSQDVSMLASAQDLLYADNSWSVLIILQAMDAAGKDGAIKHVMSGINPQGCRVVSFKQPSAEELSHGFLWRCAKDVPPAGQIGIFNRSYYEEVLVVRVHPELLQKQRLPNLKVDKQFWERRFEDINTFERYLSRNGVVVLKFFLNVSREEQRSRFLKRIDDPNKHWKFSASDVAERGYWDEYQLAYEDMLGETSTEWAPWYVLPADHKWVTRSILARVIAQEIQTLDLRYPTPSPEHHARLLEAKEQLMSEGPLKKNKKRKDPV